MHGQTEGKVTVTKCLVCHDCDAIVSRKTYYNTFAASVELAYGHGQPSQDAPKNIIYR